MNKLMIFATVLLLNMLGLTTASASCSVNNPSLVFGSFNTLTDSIIDSTTTITVTCDSLSNYTISLSTGYSGTYSPRHMTSGTNTLDYNLYIDTGHSQIWGDGNSGSSTVAASITTTVDDKNHQVYGRILLSTQRGAAVGIYSDSIHVTVTYG